MRRAKSEPYNPYALSPSGLLVPEHALPPRRPIALDLFCGAGGFSLGMEAGGFDVVAACDSDATAAITYMVNLGAHPCKFHWLDDKAQQRMERALQQHLDLRKKQGLTQAWVSGSNRKTPGGCRHFFFGDVRNLRGADVLRALDIEVGELDCVFGGPPCQGFSTAGKQDVMDPRNSLVREFVRLVIELQPKTMVMENVPGMLRMTTPEGIGVVDEICLSLEAGGWGTAEAVRTSLGVPTRRAAVRTGMNRTGAGAPAQREAEQQLSLLGE